MLSRIKLILPVALVLLASGQFAYAATYTYPGSSSSVSTLEEACLGYGKSLVAASNGSFTSVRFLSAAISDIPSLAAKKIYTCKLQLFYEETKDWSDVDGIAQEVLKCPIGASRGFKGPISSAVFSEAYKKYFVASSSPPSGCFEGCSYGLESNKQSSCFLVSGSKTQGYCNYNLQGTGQECSATTLTQEDWTGDSLNPDPTDECEGDDCEVNPPDPGTDPGTGGPGTDPGTGGPGTDPGTGGPGTDPGTGGPGPGPGTDPGTGGPGTDPGGPGTGGPGTGPGTGGPGTDPGTGGTDPGSPGVACKGADFGTADCPEYKQAQELNTANADITKGVEEAQKGVEDTVKKTQSDADTVLQESERSVMQRFNTFLPAPSACVNPVVNFSWVSVPIEVCRFTFVKALLTWLFSVATFIYVFRVMTSLGSTSEA
ncbi:hypothetical protein [Pseudomonas trivialis]|uniref:hypothetical protein n=1 Tax=Pseudomonas trivialis TaxID=200450 RepID=UPI000AC82DC3|nr:hypothetical protein [Pseudomonas trivialis]